MATIDPTVIREWETRYRDYNYCCIAKDDRAMIWDIDDLAALKGAGVPVIPHTLTVKSPKGYHLYFQQDDRTRALVNRDIKIGDNKVLEIKGHNKAVAAPGSIRQDGKTYIIHRDLPLAPVPDEWITWIKEHSQSTHRGTCKLRKFHPEFESEDLFCHFEWDFANEFEKDGAMYYVFAECPLAERTHDDQVRGRKTCLIIGKTVGFNCMSCGEEHNYSDLMAKMAEDGYEPFPYYIWADEDPEIFLADFSTDTDVLTADEFATHLGVSASTPEAAAAVEAQKALLPEADTIGFTYNRNDTGNAERLVRAYGNMIRHTNGRFHIWNGKVWAQDHYRKVDRMAEHIVKEILDEAALIEDEKAANSLRKFAIQSGDRARRNNMIEIASAKKGVRMQSSDFDKDLWAFNVQNGTVDLRTEELRPHNPQDNITKIAPIIYDLEAKCPTWDNFLLEAMIGDQEMIDFLAMAAGYSMTGDTSIQAMFFCHGDGENGKGVFIETLSYLLGAYGYTAAFETFVYHNKQGRDIRSDLAALVGVRFLSAEESAEGHRLDEALIKQLTGENTITTRFLYQDEFSYKPNFTLWMTSNFKPSIKSQDWGTWRRVKMIPWEFQVERNQRDEQLKSKLRKEASGILNWALRGLQRYVQAGYKMTYPAKVKAATDEYRTSQDILGQFIDARCQVGAEHKVAVSQLFSAFQAWAEVSRERHNFTLRTFGTALEKRKDHNFFRRVENDGTKIHGVRVTPTFDEDAVNALAGEEVL